VLSRHDVCPAFHQHGEGEVGAVIPIYQNDVPAIELWHQLPKQGLLAAALTEVGAGARPLPAASTARDTSCCIWLRFAYKLGNILKVWLSCCLKSWGPRKSSMPMTPLGAREILCSYSIEG
jgi:hypothetical protein